MSNAIQSKIAPPAIQHPDWCWRGACEVTQDENGAFHGRHFGEVRQGAFTWDEIAVSIVANDIDRRDGRAAEEPLIALRIAEWRFLEGVDDDNKWRLGETKLMEPEEAELLARRLLEAVAEWRAVRA